MEFSPSVPCSSGLVRWSPNGTLLAHAVGARVILRDAASLKVLASHCCLDAVDTLFWSPTSEFFGASILGLAVTHVFCVSDKTWTAKISEGPIGLSTCRFAPDGRHLLSTSDFGAKLTIWSLSSKQVHYVKLPVCLEFSPDGSRLAVVERQTAGSSGESGCCCSVAVYNSSSPDWEELSRFPTRCSDPAGVSWQPGTGEKIAVWNGPLEHLLQLFSTSGRVLLNFSTDGLGIRSLAWSPCGQILMTGSLGSSELRIFNTVNCTYFASFEHTDVVGGDDFVTENSSVFEEKELPAEDIDGKIIQEWLNSKETVYEAISHRPVKIPTSTSATSPLSPGSPNRSKTSVAGGVCEILPCPDGRHLATRDESSPCTAWVWDLQELRLSSVLVHRDPVTSLAWEPCGGGGAAPARLALMSSGSSPAVSLWSPLGVVVLKVPVAAPTTADDVLVPSRVRWNPQGRGAMCLAGREGFVCSKISRRDGRTKNRVEVVRAAVERTDA